MWDNIPDCKEEWWGNFWEKKYWIKKTWVSEWNNNFNIYWWKIITSEKIYSLLNNADFIATQKKIVTKNWIKIIKKEKLMTPKQISKLNQKNLFTKLFVDEISILISHSNQETLYIITLYFLDELLENLSDYSVSVILNTLLSFWYNIIRKET